MYQYREYIVLVLLLLINNASALYDECKGEANNSGVLEIEPQIISQTANGIRYRIQQGDNLVHIMNVTGTPYEMGFAQGKLMKEELIQNLDSFQGYVEQQITEQMKGYGVPNFLLEMATQFGMTTLDLMLELNYFVTIEYTPKRFIEEMKGMGDALGGEHMYKNIRNLNFLPELTQAACSIVGTWKQSTIGEKMYTLRALDWAYDAPINRNPQITIYHSTEKTETTSYAFANIGYTGFIGALTAVSSTGVSIQEKVWLPKYEVPMTYYGKPWAFVLRDLAQFGTTLQSMIDIIYNTHRTVKIHVGVASKISKEFEAMNYSWKVLNIFNDKNYTDYSYAHPQLDGVVYFNKHTQPSNDPCLGDILKQNWGNITAETHYRDITGFSKTGDSQICVTDVYNSLIYLSYSSYGTNIPAYKRPVMKIDLKPFFGQQDLPNKENKSQIFE